MSMCCLVLLSGCGFIKPEPLTLQERQDYIEEDKKLREKYSIDIKGPMTLYDAMARTILANTDYQVQRMEKVVANGEFEKAKLEMLPELRATGSYAYRDPQSASKSVNLDTGEVSTGGYTSSEEKERFLGDVTFSWNLLDFGLSYYQAKQQADAVLVRHEMQRKVLQNLMVKVRYAYWKAYFAQFFEPKVVAILAETRVALEKSKKTEQLRLRPPMETLRYQRALYEIISQLENLKSELDLAKIELRTLIDAPFGAKLTLLAPGNPDKEKLNATFPELKDMIDLALNQRPEVRQAMYQARSSSYEVRKAILKMLPGLELKAALNYDSNTYLRDNSWSNLWAHVTGNIMDILTAPTRIEHAESTVNLAEHRRLAVHVAVISQVQIAVRQYSDSIASSQRAKAISNIDAKMNTLMKNEVSSSAGNPLESIRQDASALFSELNHYKRYAEAHNSYGRVVMSMGLDMLPGADLSVMSFNELRNKLMLTQNFAMMDVKGLVNRHKLAMMLENPKDEEK